MTKDVAAFARKNKLPVDLSGEILNLYLMKTNEVTKNYLREKLAPLGLDLISNTRAIINITSWCVQMYSKYTSEEE